MASSCADLVHALPGRWRYRLRSGTPIPWDRLEQELQQALPASQWRWRINRRSSSLLIEAIHAPAAASQQQAWQGVVAALERSGATPPPPEVVRVKVRVVRQPGGGIRRWLKVPANLLSLLAATGLLGLAALLLLAGLLGLILPLAPGLPLLLLALALVEIAFQLRRPFTAPATR